MIAIGCDHGGFELAAKIMKDFDEKGIGVVKSYVKEWIR